MISGIVESYDGERLIGWAMAPRPSKNGKFDITYTKFKYEATRFPLEIASHVKKYLSYGKSSKVIVVEH